MTPYSRQWVVPFCLLLITLGAKLVSQATPLRPVTIAQASAPAGTPGKATAVGNIDTRSLRTATFESDHVPRKRLARGKPATESRAPLQDGGGPGPAPGPMSPVATGPSFIGLQMGSPPVEPADPQLAAGPSKLLEMVNVAGQVYDRNGNALGSSFALDGPGGFFQIPSAYEEQGDPIVHYDVLSGRFFAAMVGGDANGGTGVLALAVSSGSDPQGTWKVYQFTVSGYFPDFPKLGISDDKVILTANLFDLKFNNTGCPTTLAQCLDFENAYWVIDKADLVNFAVSADLTFFSSTCSHNFCYETIVPAVSLSSTTTHYMGTLNFSEPSTVLTVLSVTGNPGLGNVAVTVNNFAVASISSPQDARQPGVSAPRVATNFQDFFSAAFRDGMLWLGGNKGCSSSGFTDSACLDLIQVNTGTMSVAQNLTVSDSGAYLYYPDITIGRLRPVVLRLLSLELDRLCRRLRLLDERWRKSRALPCPQDRRVHLHRDALGRPQRRLDRPSEPE